VAVFLLSAGIGPQSVVAQHDRHDGSAANISAQGDEFARALATGMDKMHREMMAPSSTGNADVDFLATMIPHHAGAVEMARDLRQRPARSPSRRGNHRKPAGRDRCHASAAENTSTGS
jgi:uncharacterized protein (DUF305 family)